MKNSERWHFAPARPEMKPAPPSRVFVAALNRLRVAWSRDLWFGRKRCVN